MKPTTIDEYIASQPEDVRPRLQEIREIIRSRIPQSAEAVKWGNPAILHSDGMILVMFAAYKQHINVVVTPSAKDALADKLADFETGKGSMKIPHSMKLPREIIENLVDERIRQYREDGVKWM